MDTTVLTDFRSPLTGYIADYSGWASVHRQMLIASLRSSAIHRIGNHCC